MILGAGGYGRTVADIAEQSGYTVFFLMITVRMQLENWKTISTIKTVK